MFANAASQAILGIGGLSTGFLVLGFGFLGLLCFFGFGLGLRFAFSVREFGIRDLLFWSCLLQPSSCCLRYAGII